MLYHLKLKKALSYTGIITATKEQPNVFVEEEEVAKAAVASGYFEIIEKVENSKESSDTDTKVFEDKKIEELKNIAIEKGIDVTTFKKKAEYIEAILAKEAEEKQNDDNKADYEEF